MTAAQRWLAALSDLPPGFWLAPALAIAVRVVGLSVNLQPPEVFEYDQLAHNLLDGRGYVVDHDGTDYRGYSSGLLYTALTTIGYALGPTGPDLLRVAQLLIAAFTTVVVVFLAGRLGAGRAAVAAGVCVALHPALVYYDLRKLHPLGLDTLLSTAFVAALLVARRAGPWRAAVCGAILGAAILERLTFAPMLAVAAFWIGDGLPARARVRALAAFTGATLLMLAPWIARNQRVFGAPILSTMAPEYFFIGNVPPSKGSCLLPSGDRVIDAAPAAFRERLDATDERGQAALFREASWDFVARAPQAFVAGVARKLAYFWIWAPHTGVSYPPLYRRAYLALYVVLLTAALLGAWHLARGPAEPRRALTLIAALGATVSCFQALMYVELRHRWALEPLLLVLAVFAVEKPASAARVALRDTTRP